MPKRGENIYRRKDGRWEGRIKINCGSDGKTRYKSVYGKTYKSVKEKLIQIKSERPSVNTSFCKTVHVLFDEWLAAVRLRVKSSTYNNYRMKIQKHILPEFGDIRYDKLDVNMIHDFISEKISSGLSEKYVSDIIIVFKSMAKYMSRIYGFKNVIADAVLPRNSVKETPVLSGEQQNILHKYLTGNMNSTALCILLSMYTGIRIGEVCCLMWGDIDFENNTLSINKTVQRMQNTGLSSTTLVIGSPKSKSSSRIIPISSFLQEILREYRKSPDTYILSECSNITEPRTLQRRFKTILKKAGLPDVNYHSLRHMFATNCIKIGFDVRTLSEILGHASVETTLNRYVHSSMSRKIECMNMMTPAV